MKRKKSIIFAVICIGTIMCSITQAQDALNDIFSPSVDRGHIINIGGDKESVGNNLFEGSTTIEIKNDKKCAITKTITQVSKSLCAKNNGKRNDTRGYCVNNEAIFTSATSKENCIKHGIRSSNICKIHGKRVDASDKKNCEEQKATWTTNTKVAAGKQDPILVRIAKLLLRITIALSITFTLVNAIRYATSPEKEAQKKLLNIVRGIMIALGSLAIIYIVQSITTQTITEVQRGDVRALQEE